MECAKDMYYDNATKSCAFCSELCFSVDIQGTRDQCVKLCPGFLETLEASTIKPHPLSARRTEDKSSALLEPQTVALIIIGCAIVMLLVGFILISKRKALIKRLKRQECCVEGLSSQPHVQESGITPSQPQDAFLAHQGYPDLPMTFVHSFNSHQSNNQHQTNV